MKGLLLAVGAIAWLAVFGLVAQSQAACANFDEVAAKFLDKWGEAPHAVWDMGPADDGAQSVLVHFVNYRTGTWTLVAFEGACYKAMVAAGGNHPAMGQEA